MVGATFKFVELYAGYGGFSAFVKTILGEQCQVMDPLDIHGGWDILTEDGLKRAEQAVIDSDHAHIAWPCRSFTRARRSDEHGEVEVIRSDERPEGWNHPLAVEGNEHLSRVSKLVLLARLHGTTVSLEKSMGLLCMDLQAIGKGAEGDKVAAHQTGSVRIWCKVQETHLHSYRCCVGSRGAEDLRPSSTALPRLARRKGVGSRSAENGVANKLGSTVSGRALHGLGGVFEEILGFRSRSPMDDSQNNGDCRQAQKCFGKADGQKDDGCN